MPKASRFMYTLSTLFGGASLLTLAVGLRDLYFHSWWCIAEIVVATFFGIWCASLFMAGTKENGEELQRDLIAKQQVELNAAAMKWVTNNDPRTSSAPRTAEELLKAVAAQDRIKTHGGFRE